MSKTTAYIPVREIRVSKKQMRRVSRDKVARHMRLLDEGAELMAIEVNRLADGTYVIAGNGRHRYFAYLELGYTFIPVTEKSRWLEQLLIWLFGRTHRTAPPQGRFSFWGGCGRVRKVHFT